jgi:hypothetical protein
MAVAFWLELVRACAKWKGAPTSSCFWPGWDASALVLDLGDPPPTSLTEAWFGDKDNEHTMDLSASTPTPSFGAMDPAIVKMVRAETVAEALALALAGD